MDLLARHLGVDGPEATLLVSAYSAWLRWCCEDPGLAVVADLADLPEWTRHAQPEAKNGVLARLATLTAQERDAVTVLAWLLQPGARRIAIELCDLHPDIEGVVAGQLWIEASRAHEVGGAGIAAAVLRRLRRRVCAELGVGDAGRRCDRVWAESTYLDPGYDVAAADDSSESEVDRATN